MPVIISMLRGINVGGHKQIRMHALRALYESLELPNSQTYIQSGNVIFKSEETNLARLAAKIEGSIEQTFGFTSTVILRTVPELRNAIAANPFARTAGLNSSRLLVNFLVSAPHPEAVSQVRLIDFAPEKVHVVGREVYIYYPQGMARPKVPWASIEKMLKTPSTGRNLNTVTKLLSLAEALERN